MKKFFTQYYEIITAIIVFLIYALTVAKSTVSLDNGELAVTSYFLGIPHPSGYPLFTITGFIFSHLPLPLRVIEKLNILSSIYSAIAFFFLLKTLKILIDELELNNVSHHNLFALRKLTESEKLILILLGGLIFAFSKTFWFQSTNYEVYSLNILLINALTFYSLKAYSIEKNFSLFASFHKKNWLIVFIIFGLILTNHLAGIIVIIPVLYIYFLNYNPQKLTRLISFLILSSLVAITFYSYILIRGSMDIIVGFGHPQNINETFEHITGKIYQQLFLKSIEDFFKNIYFFFSSLIFHFDKYDFNSSEFNLNILFVIPGFISLYFLFREIFYFFIISLILFVLFPSLYGISDIDSYYIPAYFVISIFITSGFYLIIKLSENRSVKNLLIVLFSVLISLQFIFNFNRVDQSENFMNEDYFKNITKNLEPGSRLINNSSMLHSLSLYFQLVERFKPDIVTLTYPLINTKWYINQINKIYGNGKKIILDENNSTNINFINNQYYFTIEMGIKIFKGEIKIPENFELIPYGLVFKLVQHGTYVEQKNDMYDVRFSEQNFQTKYELNEIIKEMLILRINYELTFNRKDKMEELKKIFLSKYSIEKLPYYLR